MKIDIGTILMASIIQMNQKFNSKTISCRFLKMEKQNTRMMKSQRKRIVVYAVARRSPVGAFASIVPKFGLGSKNFVITGKLRKTPNIFN